jgi:hypothetical protein
MQQLQKLYRANYTGEDIITRMDLIDGAWIPESEFVPNPVLTSLQSTQAVVLGNGESRAEFDLRFISGHKGGYPIDRLQSYGCNALYRNFTPDYLVAVGNSMIDEIIESEYYKDNIVYANADVVTRHPGKFYLIPQNPMLNAGAIATYMACFDGHKRVFLIGHDMYDEETMLNNIYKDTNGYGTSVDSENGEFYLLSLASVAKTYSDVEFIRVMTTDSHWLHPELSTMPNFRQIDYRTFTLEADLGQLN